jgi:hypothetical protein
LPYFRLINLPKHLILNKNQPTIPEKQKKPQKKIPENLKSQKFCEISDYKQKPPLIDCSLPAFGGYRFPLLGGFGFWVRAFVLLACVVGLGLFGFGLLPFVCSLWWGGVVGGIV